MAYFSILTITFTLFPYLNETDLHAVEEHSDWEDGVKETEETRRRCGNGKVE